VKTLIIKLGATGDVVRTTTLLHVLEGEIHWLTSDNNAVMLEGAGRIAEIIPWKEARGIKGRTYDRVINLEDTLEVAALQQSLRTGRLFGAYLNGAGKMDYTDDASEWFDLSLISRFGRKKADRLKLENRKTFQEMIFAGLGYTFSGQPYHLPLSPSTDLAGDIAIAPESGNVWPMKRWAYFNDLKILLEKDGYTVNFLPQRKSLLEHIGDIRNHRFLISGDSLPMHIGLGFGIKCLSIFICTSPWEIYDYGVQKKMVSPYLERYFYRRDFDPEAPASIPLDQVYQAVKAHLTEAGRSEGLTGLVRSNEAAYRVSN